MKAIKFYALFAVLVFLSTSCVEKSDKYLTAIAQRDSLAIEKQELDSSYNQTITLLNDIEAGFVVISQNEKQMQINLKGLEGKKTNQREIIAAQMKAIKESLEQNRAKIAELRNLESKKRKANTILTETINRLQIKMDEQVIQIQTLQAELMQKNIVIDELTTTVVYQQNVLEQQKTKITEQVSDMNTAWYCVASTKLLKEAKIVTDAGLFQSKKVMENEFDKKAFTQIDIRNTSLIYTNSKNAKILSSHPQNSYILETGAENKISIKITDAAKFWSISKYLVVQI